MSWVLHKTLEGPITEEWLMSIGFERDYARSKMLSWGKLETWVVDGDRRWAFERKYLFIKMKPNTRRKVFLLLELFDMVQPGEAESRGFTACNSNP